MHYLAELLLGEASCGSDMASPATWSQDTIRVDRTKASPVRKQNAKKRKKGEENAAYDIARLWGRHRRLTGTSPLSDCLMKVEMGFHVFNVGRIRKDLRYNLHTKEAPWC